MGAGTSAEGGNKSALCCSCTGLSGASKAVCRIGNGDTALGEESSSVSTVAVGRRLASPASNKAGVVSVFSPACSGLAEAVYRFSSTWPSATAFVAILDVTWGCASSTAVFSACLYRMTGATSRPRAARLSGVGGAELFTFDGTDLSTEPFCFL